MSFIALTQFIPQIFLLYIKRCSVLVRLVHQKKQYTRSKKL